MRKQLITTLFVSTFAFSAPSVLAQIESTLEAEIDVNSRGAIEAEATQMGGQSSKVEADAAVVGVEIDASERSQINSEMVLDIEVNHRGDITAEATQMGGRNNEVSASAGVVSIELESGGK